MMTLERPLDFVLPPELEARVPPEARGLRRDQVRLLVSYIGDNRIIHAQFGELANFLRPGDLVVANDSATLPAALTARRSDGTEIALHLSTALGGQLWVVEPRQTEVTAGEVFLLPGDATASLLQPYSSSRRLWTARLSLPSPIEAYLARWGRPIAYSYVTGAWPIEMYQTVYAREPGSAEMPSAGRAFTREILQKLAARGVGFATITLHTGVSSLEEQESPYPEFYTVLPKTAEAVNAASAQSRRIVAIGTTVVRALETAADARGWVSASNGWTNLIVTPRRGVRVVDALLTGFHEPKASHLAMLEAIAGRDHLDQAYQAALAGGYLWHEFGDLHLILPGTS